MIAAGAVLNYLSSSICDLHHSPQRILTNEIIFRKPTPNVAQKLTLKPDKGWELRASKRRAKGDACALTFGGNIGMQSGCWVYTRICVSLCVKCSKWGHTQLTWRWDGSISTTSTNHKPTINHPPTTSRVLVHKCNKDTLIHLVVLVFNSKYLIHPIVYVLLNLYWRD